MRPILLGTSAGGTLVSLGLACLGHWREGLAAYGVTLAGVMTLIAVQVARANEAEEPAPAPAVMRLTPAPARRRMLPDAAKFGDR
jgi:hypothetical protein